MITVSEALQHIETCCKPAKKTNKPIEKSMGLILAKDVSSPINMPPFKQSSMDGYALIHSEYESYKLIGEVQAGSSKNIALKPGEVVRIFTGARIPNDADTVVMQEHVVRNNNDIKIQKLPNKHSNVRPLGEQIKIGDIALKKGTLLDEVSIGFLVGLGVSEVSIYKTPKVSILITGNEFQHIGKKLKAGQIYDSNSITLKLALKRIGIKKISISRVEDDLKSTTKAIKKCIKKADIVLISGGISVGDYDFVKEGLFNNQAKEIFYKVNQKPGKPLWFGLKGRTSIFALPGNPASSLSCFYIYVLPLIKAQIGFQNYHLPKLKAIATADIKNTHDKTLFLKGNVSNGKASVLIGQASSMLKSFAVSNALLVIPEDKSIIKKGEQLTYIQL